MRLDDHSADYVECERASAMRRPVLTAIALQAAMLIGTSEASAMTGEELLQSCQVVLQGARTVKPDYTWVPDAGTTCWSYFAAVRDMSLLVDRRQCSALPCKNPVLGICPPEGSSLLQYVRIFVATVQKYPEMLHNDAAGIALYALRQAFPCQ
jgi:Rap1a immunity proteins